METLALAVFDRLPQYIGVTDRELRFRFINKAYAVFLGFDAESAKGRHIRDFWGEDLITEILPFIERALSGEPVVFTKRLTMKSGEIRMGKVELIPDPEGGYVSIIQDLGAYERSIRDRESLVHELDHRVNNILQLIQSILGLETQSASEETRSLLAALKSRIDALGLSYEHLRSPEPIGGWSVSLVLSRIGASIGPGLSISTLADENLRIGHSDLDAFIFIATEMARWATISGSPAYLEVRRVPTGLELSVWDGETNDLTKHAGAAGIALVESFAQSRGAGPIRGGARLSIVFPEYRIEGFTIAD